MAAGWNQVYIERFLIQAHYGASGYVNGDELEWLHVHGDWPEQQDAMPNGQRPLISGPGMGAGSIGDRALWRGGAAGECSTNHLSTETASAQVANAPGVASVPHSPTELELGIGSEGEATAALWCVGAAENTDTGTALLEPVGDAWGAADEVDALLRTHCGAMHGPAMAGNAMHESVANGCSS